MDLNAVTAIGDDLGREVYCVLGIPIDATEMSSVLRRIDVAVTNAAPFLISTPNLNFLVNSLNNPEFRESLLQSDLCPPDGMPIIWITRLLGIPIKRRIAGSDIFEALRSRPRAAGPLKIFFFRRYRASCCGGCRPTKLRADRPKMRRLGVSGICWCG